MAKVQKEAVHLVSSAGTGYFYTFRRNKKRGGKSGSKVAIKKYDPLARKHVLFEEKKLAKLKKKFVRGQADGDAGGKKPGSDAPKKKSK